MKDIKENQKGLKALADERPDVVKKNGLRPRKFLRRRTSDVS